MNIEKNSASVDIRRAVEEIRSKRSDLASRETRTKRGKLTLEELATLVGLPLSTVHSYFSMAGSGKIDVDTMDAVATRLGLTIQEFLNIGRDIDREQLLQKISAPGSHEGGGANPSEASAIEVSLERFNSLTWTINRAFAEKTNLWSTIKTDEICRAKLLASGEEPTSVQLNRHDIFRLAESSSKRSEVLALAQSIAVGNQRSKLNGWRTFDMGVERIESVLDWTNRLLATEDAVEAFRFLVSDYAGLPGVGATTASFYLYITAKALKLFEVLHPAPVPFDLRNSRRLIVGSRDKAETYREYLAAIGRLANQWHVPADLAEFSVYERF